MSRCPLGAFVHRRIPGHDHILDTPSRAIRLNDEMKTLNVPAPRRVTVASARGLRLAEVRNPYDTDHLPPLEVAAVVRTCRHPRQDLRRHPT